MVDAGYALEIYDEFAANYTSKQTGKEEFKNKEPVDTFESIEDDEAYVEGRWACNEAALGHQTTVITGASFAGITDQNVINIVKAGAVYPDKPESGITGGKTVYPEFHGGWYREEGGSKVYINYIACYELMTRLALNGGSGSGVSSYTDIWGINSKTYNRIVSVVSASRVGNQDFGTLLQNYGNTPTNRKYFLWGCAMHMLGDTFAHSTKKRNATTGAIGSDISDAGGADNPAVVPNRYETAKKLVSYGMRCLNNNTYGDYFQFYQALKYAPHDGTWAKKKLLTYAEDNGGGFGSGERSYFEKASASD